jgi:hypothetical protein
MCLLTEFLIVWYPNLYCGFHRSPPSNSILSQLKSVLYLKPHLFKRSILILSSHLHLGLFRFANIYEQKNDESSYFLHLSVSSSLLVQNILLSTLFSNAPSLCSSGTETGQLFSELLCYIIWTLNEIR